MLNRLLGIQTHQRARSAAELSALMVFGMGVYTAYLVHMSRIHSMPIPFFRPAEALFDAFFFFFLAAGIWFGVRMAGAAAVAVFAADQWLLFEKGTFLYQSLMFLVLVILIRGMLACFLPVARDADVEHEQVQRSGTPRALAAAGFLTVLAVILAASFWYMTHRSALSGKKAVSNETPAFETAVSAEELSRFELVTGETVHGKIIREDDVYYQIDVQGSERILIKEDIKKAVIAADSGI